MQGVVGKVDEWTRLLRSKLQKLNDVLGCCDRSLCPDDHPVDQARLLQLQMILLGCSFHVVSVHIHADVAASDAVRCPPPGDEWKSISFPTLLRYRAPAECARYEA